jgi:hypothetical protein
MKGNLNPDFLTVDGAAELAQIDAWESMFPRQSETAHDMAESSSVN